MGAAPPPDGPPPGGGGTYGPPPDGGGYGPPPGGGGYGPPPGGGGGYGPPPGGGGGYGPPPGFVGGYGPPMAPMPPPPPQKKGLSGAAIALIVVVILVVLGGTCTCVVCYGVSRSAKSAVTTSEPVARTAPKPPPTAAAPADNWITAERPYVKFLAPAGWTTKITSDKEWGIFKSPKQDAVLAFTTFTRPGESTVRLGKAAGVLGVADINWGSTRVGAVGKDKFDAHVGDGSCNFEGPGGYIWYATVNTGTSDQILLIFTVSPSAPKSRRAEAQAAIDSLQRR
jgi:hypothetical protein